MELIILGSGTCVSGLPNIEDRYPPALFLRINNEKFLFECSDGIRFRLNKAGIEYTDIKHVFLTHSHPDHCSLVQFIQSVYVKGLYDVKYKNDKIYIYCPKQLKKDFKDLWNFYLPEIKNCRYEFPELVFEVMEDKDLKKVGDILVKSNKLIHGFGKVDIIGFRLESREGIFVYSGETKLCDNIRDLAKDADIFVCESSARVGDKNSTYGHLSPYEAGLIAKETGVKKLILFHYSGLDSDNEMTKDCRSSGFNRELIIAKDFQVIKK